MIRSLDDLEKYTCTLYAVQDQLRTSIYKKADQAFAAGLAARDLIRTTKQLKARQEYVRNSFLQAIGGLPSSNSPLLPVITGVVQAEGYLVEKIIFQSRPEHYVTANLYLPAEREEKTGAVLFLCGHELEGKHSLYYHKVCLRLVQAGLIVFALDPIGQGERLNFPGPTGEKLWGTKDHQRLGVQSYLLNESVARYFLHDAIRAIDYLETRPEIDREKIGVTGNSGGGTQTALLMLVEDRIAAAAPATFISNRQQYMHAGGVQDAEQVWPGLTGLGIDHEDILLSFAPRPVMVLAASSDFFPIEATRETVARTERFWQLAGNPKGLKLVEDRAPHSFTDFLAIAAAQFFSWELLEKSVCLSEDPLTPLPQQKLLCTKSGQVVTEFNQEQAFKITEWQKAKANTKQLLSTGGETVRKSLIEALRQKVAFRPNVQFNLRQIELGTFAGLTIEYFLWWSHLDVMNSGMMFRNDISSPGFPIICLWQGGTTKLEQYWDWIKERCTQGEAVFVLNCSGEGPHEPGPLYRKDNHLFFGMLHKLADELIWLGDSLAKIRTYDLLQCINLLNTLFPEPATVQVYAEGLFQVYPRLAMLLNNKIVLQNQDNSVEDKLAALFSAEFCEANIMSIVFPGLLNYLVLTERKGRYAHD